MAGDKYAALRAEFVDNDDAGVPAFARRKGITGRDAERLGEVASRQGWLAMQKERQDKDRETARKAQETANREEAERVAKKLAQGWAQARLNVLTNYLSAQAAHASAAKALANRDAPITAQEARALMGGALDGIKGYNLATGNPTEITEHTGAVQVAQQWTNEQLTEFARAALGKV